MLKRKKVLAVLLAATTCLGMLVGCGGSSSGGGQASGGGADAASGPDTYSMIDNFDVTQGVRFSTYGVPMIIGEIRRYLRDNSAIRVSRSMRDTAYKVLQAREKLMRETQREPTVEQIAKELDIPREEIVFAMDAIVDPMSLYDPIFSDGGDTLCVMDQISDRSNTDESWIEQIALKDAISRLGQRERNILAMRFYQGKTQMEVSAEIGISQAQVSRLEKSAIQSIKRGL